MSAPKSVLNKPKVFGIGVSRTGTTSLNKALNALGYNSIHYPENLDAIDKADAATDITVAHRYKELDKKYPNSKFILTTRNLFTWLKSMKTHNKRKPMKTRSKEVLETRKAMYGFVHFSWVRLFFANLKHQRSVKNHFKNRPQDLLIMNIIKGDGWEKLCPFLGEEIPNIPFPKLNTSVGNKMRDETDLNSKNDGSNN